MEDLIKALQILLKYGNPRWPTWCERGCLHIADIDPKVVTMEDKTELVRLGFKYNNEEFFSFRFGSA